MFSRRIQERARELVVLLLRPLARTGITPNTLTMLGLLLSIVTAAVIAEGFLLAGGLLMLFAGIFDMFDGAIARISNAATTFGAFLDSTLDRYSESIILFGLLYYTLQRPGLHDRFWPFSSEQPWMTTLIYIAVVGSLMVSYTKARAEGLGLECRTGLLARPERVVILAIGLLTGTVIWALVLLAIFSNVTAIERIFHVWRITHMQQSTAQAEIAGAGPSLASTHIEPIEERSGEQENSANKRHVPMETNDSREAPVRSVPTGVPPFTGGVQQE